MRAPTPFRDILRAFKSKVTEVNESQIREFCTAIYGQPPIHPPLVREWHDPGRLNTDRIELHRRRSIHVHCWSPEEFASLIATALACGLISMRASMLYISTDEAAEFGVVLDRAETADSPLARCHAFIAEWVRFATLSWDNPEIRLSSFAHALARDLASIPGADNTLSLPLAALVDLLKTKRNESAALKGEISDLKLQIDQKNRVIVGHHSEIARQADVIKTMEQSKSWKITAPIRTAVNAIRNRRV